MKGSNYVYTMLPGARLEVGPHGQLEEQLGDALATPGGTFPGSRACCAECAAGAPRCGGAKGLGDLSSLPTWVMPVAIAGAAAVGVVWWLRSRKR